MPDSITLDCNCCPDPTSPCPGITLPDFIYITFSGFSDECLIQTDGGNFFVKPVNNGSYKLTLRNPSATFSTSEGWLLGSAPSGATAAWYGLLGAGFPLNMYTAPFGGNWAACAYPGAPGGIKTYGKAEAVATYIQPDGLTPPGFIEVKRVFVLMLYAAVRCDCTGGGHPRPGDVQFDIGGYIVMRTYSRSLPSGSFTHVSDELSGPFGCGWYWTFCANPNALSESMFISDPGQPCDGGQIQVTN